MGTSELKSIGLPPTRMGPPTLVQLATSLCLEPVTDTKYQYQNESRQSPCSKLEYPELPSGIGASETETSLPKGPYFFLHKYLLRLEAIIAGQQHGFFPTTQK
ncbi:hypothetical protein O181_084455 [Austropuccinia psidii MF-1]|uniref:Uncharacterized protein n=1 Tax=Austropuccinia psidii MF-1 TaxID=1389203 RepID=A0A9Q3FQ83_9BASI|nr:hypothetical protein [Austropuccinia psidii MF-1]